jgi:hypothetical protein
LVIIGAPQSFCPTTPGTSPISRFGNVVRLTRQTTELSIDQHDNASLPSTSPTIHQQSKNKKKEPPGLKNFLVLFLCLSLSLSAIAADSGYKVVYDGGSVTDVKTGTGLHLAIGEKDIQFFKDDKQIAIVPAASVTEISYGQDVHRRVGSAIAIGVFTLGVGGLMALTKSKKHFVGLTWANGDKKGGLAMQCDKNEYRGILAGLEGVTGKKAVNSETMTVKN